MEREKSNNKFLQGSRELSLKAYRRLRKKTRVSSDTSTGVTKPHIMTPSRSVSSISTVCQASCQKKGNGISPGWDQRLCKLVCVWYLGITFTFYWKKLENMHSFMSQSCVHLPACSWFLSYREAEPRKMRSRPWYETKTVLVFKKNNFHLFLDYLQLHYKALMHQYQWVSVTMTATRAHSKSGKQFFLCAHYYKITATLLTQLMNLTSKILLLSQSCL